MSQSMPVLAAAAVIGLCSAVLVSCEKPPTAPTFSPASDPTPASLLSLRIDGPSLLTPGASARYIALGGFSDGTTRDVTATSEWLTSNAGTVTIGADGRASAGVPGQSVIAAVNGLRRTSIEVMVLTPGTFRLSGTVSQDGQPIADATVELLEGSGVAMSTQTDASGVYRLFGVAGSVEVRASKDGYMPQVNRLSVSSNSTLDFRLSPTRR
jgi:Carboxypeptidase regulatory-like domain